jgi:hypothetical protein
MKSLASQFLVAILFLIRAILYLRDAIIQHDFYWNLFGAFLYLIVFILVCRHIMRNMRAGR